MARSAFAQGQGHLFRAVDQPLQGGEYLVGAGQRLAGPPPPTGEAVSWTAAVGVSVSGNNLTKTANYGQNSTALSIAQDLAGQFSNDGSSCATASRLGAGPFFPKET